ncbi:hypothetical protein LLT6_07230 [Lactococcus cremoris subsp. cremoris TIFN6]|uniref:Uncharacterized protein n=1 Tax=Lactococcus cremoris subsp. cremoris TIFN6 TaxID=1234876 RepID=T0SEQ2_LACLC|nr:hypothetical protein LLT6_07230 [Lactococcus cremoris subsp. cremoris TIFN6]
MLIKDPKIVDIKSLYSEGLISLFLIIYLSTILLEMNAILLWRQITPLFKLSRKMGQILIGLMSNI